MSCRISPKGIGSVFWDDYEFSEVKYRSARSFSILNLLVLEFEDWQQMLSQCSREPPPIPQQKEKLRHQLAVVQACLQPKLLRKAGINLSFDSAHNSVVFTSNSEFTSSSTVRKGTDLVLKSWKNPDSNPFTTKPRHRTPRRRCDFKATSSVISDMLHEGPFSISRLPPEKHVELAPLIQLLNDPPRSSGDLSETPKEAAAEHTARQHLATQMDYLEFLDMSRRLASAAFDSDLLSSWFNLGLSIFEEPVLIAAEDFARHRILLRQKCSTGIQDKACRTQVLCSDLIAQHLLPLQEAANIGASLQSRISSLTTTRAAQAYSPEFTNTRRTRTAPRPPVAPASGQRRPFHTSSVVRHFGKRRGGHTPSTPRPSSKYSPPGSNSGPSSRSPPPTNQPTGRGFRGTTPRRLQPRPGNSFKRRSPNGRPSNGHAGTWRTSQ